MIAEFCAQDNPQASLSQKIAHVVRQSGRAKIESGSFEEKERAVEIIKGRATSVAHQNVLDIRIEPSGRSSLGAFIDNSTWPSMGVVTFSRNRSQCDESPAGRRQ